MFHLNKWEIIFTILNILDVFTTLIVLGPWSATGGDASFEGEFMPLAKLALTLGPIWFLILKLTIGLGFIGLIAYTRTVQSRIFIWRLVSILMLIVVIINSLNIYML